MWRNINLKSAHSSSTCEDEIYDRYERGAGGPKLDLTKPDIEKLILDTFIQTLGRDRAQGLNKSVDLYAFGVDSLQAMRVRNICQARLDLRGHQLSHNGSSLTCHILFSSYKVAQWYTRTPLLRSETTSCSGRSPANFKVRLADHIINVRAGNEAAQKEIHQQDLMLSMLEKWCNKLDQSSVNSSYEDGGSTQPQTVVSVGHA